MSRMNRDEDLFAESTMSFGEHIEELRGALARALVGLAIGVGIAFFFADDAVQWIEKPLKDGLVQFNVAKATTDFADELTPAQLDMITESRMAPTEIHFEAEVLWQQLHSAYPTQIPNLDVQGYAYETSDLSENLTQTCQSLAQKHPEGSFQELAVSQMSDEQRKTVAKVAELDSPSSDHLAAVTSALNAVLGNSDLVASITDKMVKSLFVTDEQHKAIQLLIDRATTDASYTTRVNRLLMAAAFSPYLPPEKPKILRMIAWEPVEASIQTLRAEEAFMTWFKAAFVVGAIVSAPWVFYQLWNFVAAGLYPHEKNYVHTYLPFSLGLFFAGAALAFFFVFPYVLKFLFGFNQMIGADINPRLNDWLGFALFLPLGFGVSFQLPLVMLLLERIGVVSVDVYLTKWRIAVLVIAILSMLLTPADPSSMLLMGIPLTVLYFGGIGLCKWMPKRSSPLGEGYDP